LLEAFWNGTDSLVSVVEYMTLLQQRALDVLGVGKDLVEGLTEIADAGEDGYLAAAG
jgi:hypothetical protein